RRPARPSRQRSSAVRRFRDAWLTATGRHRSMREAAARDERADTPKVERVTGAKAEARKGEAEPPRERKKECAAAVRLRADALWRDRQASADATMRAQCAVGPKLERVSRAKAEARGGEAGSPRERSEACACGCKRAPEESRERTDAERR